MISVYTYFNYNKYQRINNNKLLKLLLFNNKYFKKYPKMI